MNAFKLFKKGGSPNFSYKQESKMNDSTVITINNLSTVKNYFRFPTSRYGKQENKLGKGTTASVIKYHSSSSIIAVKIFKYQDKEIYENFESFKERISKEIRIHLLVNPESPMEGNKTHIIKFIDFFSVNKGDLYYVMEFGGQQLSAHYSANFVDLSKFTKLDLFKQLVTAIDYLQKHNVNHRDIKPENCCVSKDGVLKVIDFGSSIEGNKGYGLVGSKLYVAPEVLSTISYNPFKSDIWSLGVVFVYFYYYKALKWSVANDYDDPKFKLFRDNNEQFKYVVKDITEEPESSIVELLLFMLKVNAHERLTTKEILERLGKII